MTKLEQAARQALEALSDCVDDSRTVLSQNEQIYTERYRPHVLIEQERVVKDAETAIAALHEALSGVQALSAAPAGFVPVAAFDRLHAHAESLAARLLAASPTPPAEQQATKETSGGFHVWRDIATAPKDGSRFVATGHNYGLYSEVRHTCVAQWFRGCWMEASDWNETSELKYLTHWMPLPSPPDDVAAPAEQQAAPKAAPGESLTRDQIREVFMAHGFTVKEGQTDLKQYVYDAAHALLELVAAPQQEAPNAAPGEPDPADIIAGALQISRGHAIEMMREALEATPQQEAHHLTQALTDPENQPNQYGAEFGMSGQQMNFKIGNQLFRLAYEPDDQQEFEFMKRMLIHAFSTFTPDVKAAPGEQNAVSAEWLEQAYREGWAACRDAETIGEEAEDWAFGNSTANSRMIDAQQAAPRQEAQEPVAGLVRCDFDDECDFCGEPEGGSYTRLVHNAEDCTEAEFYICACCLHKAIDAHAKKAAPQPAPAPLSERDAFEAAWEKLHGKRPVLWSHMFAEHKMETPSHSEGKYFARDEQAAWKLWQARAALAAQGDTP